MFSRPPRFRSAISPLDIPSARSTTAPLPLNARARTQPRRGFARRSVASPAFPCLAGPAVSLLLSDCPSRHASQAVNALGLVRVLPLRPRHDKIRTTARTLCARAPQQPQRPRQPVAWPPNSPSQSPGPALQTTTRISLLADTQKLDARP